MQTSAPWGLEKVLRITQLYTCGAAVAAYGGFWEFAVA